MNWLDVVIVVAVVVGALHGLRVGAVAQFASLVGFLAGLALGVALVVNIDDRVHQGSTKTLLALALLLVPAGVLAGVGRHLGSRLGSVLHRLGLGLVDRLLGAAFAMAGTLLICWLFASVLINSSSPTVSRAIESSRIIRRVNAVLPPVPDAFASVQRYLAASGFPEAIANALPETTGPVVLPSSAQFQDAVRIGALSTVKVIAVGCGGELEGSGFVSTDGLVVTNAHVIAGTHSITVYDGRGERSAATPVLIDDDFDLAVLRVSGITVPELGIDSNYVERGTPAVVLGYPGGGPLNAQRAGIASRFVAVGRNIYGEALTSRVLYELRTEVRPGNSGGPLLSPAGEVLGVVFSRSASNTDIGYALSSPGVAARLSSATHEHQAVPTGSCAN